jgi:hypothetical protein
MQHHLIAKAHGVPVEIAAQPQNSWAERLAGTVRWLDYYLDQSSDVGFEERAAELRSILGQIEDIRDEIATEIEDAIYRADPDAAADARAW